MPKKFTYQDVKSYIKSFNYKLLSYNYHNNYYKLKVKCPKNHIYEVSFSNFKKGSRCPECKGVKKYTYEFVKSYIEKEGYELISKEYKNNKTKLKTLCPFGHEYEISFGNFKNGTRCKNCWVDNKKLTYKEVKEYIEKEGYELLSKEYKNARKKLKVQCLKNHIYEVTFDNFKHGYRCPVCSAQKTSSIGEKEVFEYVKSIYFDKLINNDRNTIKNPNTRRYLELDIYLKDINKAIEFSGVYWHSLEKAIKYDKIKKDQCKKLNIDLLVITDIDWLNNQEKCKEIIKYFIFS